MSQTDELSPEPVLLHQLDIRLISLQERPRWDHEMCEGHYLKNANLVGDILRYVVTTTQRADLPSHLQKDGPHPV